MVAPFRGIPCLCSSDAAPFPFLCPLDVDRDLSLDEAPVEGARLQSLTHLRPLEGAAAVEAVIPPGCLRRTRMCEDERCHCRREESLKDTTHPLRSRPRSAARCPLFSATATGFVPRLACLPAGRPPSAPR